VKHAGPAALDQLEDLLARLRELEGLVERKRGLFYRKSSAFLHFHEDAAGLFADAKLDGREFARSRVSTAAERAALLRAVKSALAPPSSAAPRAARSRGTRRGA
jgi:hypothetical protein